MSDISVQINGLKELKKAFKKAPGLTASEINTAIKKALLMTLASALPKTPIDRGFLRNSNKTSFSQLRGVLENTAPYALFVHDGTKAHFPPASALTPWARRHGIPSGFLVSRAIAQKGTKAHPFYDQAIEEKQNEIDRVFATALNNITLKLAA